MTAVTESPESTTRTGGRRITAPPGERSLNFVVLLLLCLALNLVGLVMVLSASMVTGLQTTGSTWYFFERQGAWALIGVLAMMAMMRIDYRKLAAAAPFGIGMSAIALLLVLIPGIGVSANGSTRWLGAGPIVVQPSEFAKLAVAVFCASFLASRKGLVRETKLSLRPIFVIVLPIALAVLAQPSQGTAMIIVTIAMVILFVAGVPIAPLAGRGLLFLAGAAALAMSASYRRERVMAVLDPWSDPLNTGWQNIQSLVGIASGGVSGVGLGAGRSKWGFLPFAHTDFIFSVIAEELGLIGATTVVVMFVMLALFGIRAAASAPDRFGMLLAAGITTWITAQAFVNIAAVVGMLPISGVTLPFVSVGGSSLVVTMAAMGIVLNIARQGHGSRQGHSVRHGHPASLAKNILEADEL